MSTPVYIVDAFADRPLTGNPAAVCPLDHWLSDDVMQAVAAELNLSETVFFAREADTYRIRWFTPTREVDLVGHATLAAAWILFDRLDTRRSRVVFDSLSGPLAVERRDGGLLAMDFPARPPSDVGTDEADAVARGLGLRPVSVLGARHYLAVFETSDQIRQLQPDMAVLATLARPAVIVTAPADASTPGHDFVSRFFAPANGVPEDPVSGVSHCSLVPYWAGRLGRTALVGRQVSARGGTLVCQANGSRVEIAGRCALALEGRLMLS